IRNFMPDRPYTQYNEYIQTQYPTLDVMKELHAVGKLNAMQELWMAPRKPEVEFFDTQSDPLEVKNLAESPEHRKLIERFDRLLTDWLKEMDDKGAIPEPREVIEREEPRAK